MDHNSFKTYSAKPGEIERKWYVVDARDKMVGRLSTEIAKVIRGKHKPQFTPHVDVGDFVIVINADKIRLSGKKEETKEYFSYSGYPGGAKFRKFKDLRVNNPEYILRHAVKGMLPKNRLGRKMINKLKVYAGETHQHEAQQPEVLTIGK